MRAFLRLTCLTSFLAVAGCGIQVVVPTNPNNYSIAPANVAALRGPQSITLKNGYAEPAVQELPLQHNKLIVEQKQLTETAVVMLERALQKQGISNLPQADRSVTLRVRAQGYRMQAFRWTGQVLLEAKLGDGTVISYPNESLSPKGWENAFDGAVLFALNDLLADERFVAYINQVAAKP